jgi:large subunit ribosomal protein L32e
MTTEIKRLIRVRVEKGATFKRDGYGKKKQLSDSWRKPKGQHNKQREQKKAKGALPKPGFGSPIAVRGMHPSGFFEVLISSVKELEGIDPKTHAIRIGATVGERTRVGLQEKAIAEGFKVLNARTAKTGLKQEKILKPAKPAKVADKKKSEEKKPAKSKATAAPVKKDTKKAEKKKAEKTPAAEEKKAPVKEKKSAKPKEEPAEKAPEKTKAAIPVKSTKKSAKPKTEVPAEAKAKPKAATKTKAKKKTESGVKKNE